MWVIVLVFRGHDLRRRHPILDPVPERRHDVVRRIMRRCRNTKRQYRSWRRSPLGTYGTLAAGINDHGQIVGFYVDSNHKEHGFLYSNGTYTTLNAGAAAEAASR